jgi:FkbH-like protein
MEGHSDADLDAFYEGLQMSVIFEPITQDTIERAVSLLSRTNQFNLNQYRPSLLELKATLPLHENSFVVRYSDKDSPPTVIAVVLASIRGRYLYLKNWVMSCRVFGRGVEWATASHLKTLMLALDATALVVDFCQTERNAPAYDALRQLAFEEINIGEDLNLPTSGRVLASHLELVPESRITVSNTRTGP